MERILPSGWARPSGYSHAVAAQGRVVFIAGQIGWTPEERFETDDFVDQVRQALRNVRALVEAAGGAASDLVRMTWFITDKPEYLARRREVGRVYRDVIGAHYPAMSLIPVPQLLEDRAKVEIEATAVIGKEPTRR